SGDCGRLTGAREAIPSVREGLQPCLRDLFPTPLATTKNAFSNSLQGSDDLGQRLPIALQQTLGELPFKGVAAKVRWVERHMGQVAAGLFIGVERFRRQGRYVSAEALPQGHEFLPVAGEFRFRHDDPPKKMLSAPVPCSWAVA